MSNVGQADFNYESFKQAYDTDPALQAIVKRFDDNGVELKSKMSTSDDTPSDVDLSGKAVRQMAKSATAKRQG